MVQEELQILLQFFKALADETRLKMLGLLAQREYSVEELAALLQVKAPTISHHLARLKELNLVEMRSDGNMHYYQLNGEALRQANKLLLTPEKLVSFADSIEGDAWERKVLRDFLDGSRLKEIPASAKKRAVILKWLASQFEYGVMYKEAEVNEIIKRHHPDFAFWRRALIATKAALMQRDNGLYWRVSPEMADREQRQRMLNLLLGKFEPFKPYSQAEVDETIRLFSGDYPFLRNTLLDDGSLVALRDGKYICVRTSDVQNEQ